jgi:hypothetical protein
MAKEAIVSSEAPGNPIICSVPTRNVMRICPVGTAPLKSRYIGGTKAAQRRLKGVS